MNQSKQILLLVLTLLVCLSAADAYQKKKKKPAVQPKKKVAEQSAPVITADYGKYEFSFTTLDGKTVKLSDYAGKVVLVNIWAPWCGPCRIETPGFVKLYDEYKDKGFEILGVAVQTNETDVRSFVAKENMRWPVGINDDVAIKYGTYGLPDNYLFNPDGSVKKHFIGYTREESLRPNIEEALKSIPKKNSKSTKK